MQWKPFNLSSFVTGLVTGVLLLSIGIGGFRMLHPPSPTFTRGSGNFPAGGQNTSRMAARLGITEDELNKELQSGKTMQQIAQEHGVTFGGGGGFGRNRSGTGAAASSLSTSGAVTSVASSSSSVTK